MHTPPGIGKTEGQGCSFRLIQVIILHPNRCVTMTTSKPMPRLYLYWIAPHEFTDITPVLNCKHGNFILFNLIHDAHKDEK